MNRILETIDSFVSITCMTLCIILVVPFIIIILIITVFAALIFCFLDWISCLLGVNDNE